MQVILVTIALLAYKELEITFVYLKLLKAINSLSLACTRVQQVAFYVRGQKTPSSNQVS
jgi:hypothetical protein